MNRLPLPGADLRLDPAWLAADAADRLFAALHDTLPWRQHRLRMFGREVDTPRLACWIGDPGAVYRYSGTTFEPMPWPDVLLPLRDAVSDAAGVRFNSVLANLYRDGRDAMGWHSDDERELGARPVIASLSLGAERRFALRARHAPGTATPSRHVFALPHGSLLLMQGGTQDHYRHALPRTAKPVGARINLTFRTILR